MITGTIVIADHAISFTLPEMVGEKGSITVCEMLEGRSYTVACTHAQLAASLALAIAGDEWTLRPLSWLYELAEPLQPADGNPNYARRWIP